jgi:hypothetical protein
MVRAEAKSGIRFQSWVIYSIVCLACFGVLVEVLTRIGFVRISHLESRTAQEYKAALLVRQSSTVPSILLLGNSLPLEGIDVPQLATAFKGRASIARFVKGKDTSRSDEEAVIAEHLTSLRLRCAERGSQLDFGHQAARQSA